jgi:hypothetical protein
LPYRQYDFIEPVPKKEIPANMKLGLIKSNSETNRRLPVDSGNLPMIQKVWDGFAELLSRKWQIVVVVWLCAAAISFEGYSKQKPLWTDEILVRWVDTLPSLRDIWLQLKFGVCADPPLFHLLTHSLTSVFGSGAPVLRLPSMAGVCAMLFFIFLTLRKQIGPLYAFLGLALPFCTLVPSYAYDARPYGLMYGCIGAAIYCWAKIGDDDFNRPSLNVALGLALTAALGCHFYSVFALPAFYLGEGVRTAHRHRISWPTSWALIGATVTVGAYWPIIVGIHKYSSSYFAKPSLKSVPQMLEASMAQLPIALFLFLIFAAALVILRFRFTRHIKSDEDNQFFDLTALALGFLLLPILAWCAGLVVLKAFSVKYVLHGLFGVFLLIPLIAARSWGRDRSLGLALLLGCGLPASVFVLRGAVDNLRLTHYNDNFILLEKALPSLKGDIVVSDPLLLTELVNYSPALKARCLYLWSRDNELKYTGQDTVSLAFDQMGRMGWFREQLWSDFERQNGTFLFLTVPDSQSDELGWLRAYMEQVGRYGKIAMTIGPYVIVEAKPLDVEPSEFAGPTRQVDAK